MSVSVRLDAEETKRPAPVVSTSVAPAAHEGLDGIAAKIVWGDYLHPAEASLIAANRAEIAEAIAKLSLAPEVRKDSHAVRRARLWRAVLTASEEEEGIPSLEELRVSADIAESLANTGAPRSLYSSRVLSSLISGGDPQLAEAALRYVKLYRLKECLPVIREKFATCPPEQICEYARVLAILDLDIKDLRTLLERVDRAETVPEKAALLEVLPFWLKTAPEVMAEAETRILAEPKLRTDQRILQLWSNVATDRSLPELQLAVSDARPEAQVLYSAIGRVGPREELPKVFREMPGNYFPMVLMMGTYPRLRKEPMPELAPIVVGWLSETNQGIARLPLSSFVLAFLIDCCGREGLETAERLADSAGEAELTRAVKWKREGFTLESLQRELTAAGAVFSINAKGFKSDMLDSDLMPMFLEENKVAVRVPLRDESMPVEYPALLKMLGELKEPELTVVESDQQVDGIEQLADVNPETLEVPAHVKLRYKVGFQTPSLKVEFQPLDLRDRFDLEGVVEAFNAAAEKLGLQGRYGIVSRSADEATVVFGDVPALERILTKYGL